MRTNSNHQNPKTMNTDKNFERETKVMEMFINSSKTYLSLSSALLGLSIGFSLFVDKEKINVDFFLLSTWTLCSLSMISACVYEYLAIKNIEIGFKVGDNISYFVPKILVKRPGIIYTVMYIAFFLAVISFIILAYRNLN